MPQQHVAPVLIDRLALPSQISRLTRLGRNPEAGGVRYSEELIQGLVDLDPLILPVDDIEPAFVGSRSVCRELPLGPVGAEKYADNLLISPSGRLCLVECKLFRNGESVREVIAQVLDYGSELAGLSYDELVKAVRAASRQAEGDPIADKVLGWDAPEDDRLAFGDRVQRSLQRGDFLLLIIGDHIRPEVERIAGLLQNHATLGFALGLIEMAIYGNGEGKGPYYVQPRVLMSTEVITRTVFLTGSGSAAPAVVKVEPPSRPRTLSEQEFYGALRIANASYPERVPHLLDGLSKLGCETRLLRRLNIYMDDPTGGQINLGAIKKDGTVEFWGAAARDRALGEPIGHTYMRQLATLLPGAEVRDAFENPASWYVGHNGATAVPLGLLLAHEEAWLKAIGDVAAGFRQLEAHKASSHT